MFDELDQLFNSDIFAKKPAAATLTEETFHLDDGERREVAVLFADVKGFTAMSEKLDPEDVRRILDKLLQLFTVCIKNYGGYIDKYEGDLVMALFGAKMASEQDTERAVRAALDMLDKLMQFNAILQKNSRLTGIQLGLRIGINTGLVTTGRVGEKREGDFTVYGDSVNLASRMESNAPVNRIMLPREPMELVEHIFDFEFNGEIMVKGKSRPIAVYTVNGLRPTPLPRRLTSAFVGRAAEIARLTQSYDALKSRLIPQSESMSPALQEHSPLMKPAQQSAGDISYKPQMMGLTAQTGLGKTRLMEEWLKQLENADVPGTFGTSTSAETSGQSAGDVSIFSVRGQTPRYAQNSYCLWSAVIRDGFGIAPVDSAQNTREKLETGLRALAAEIADDFKGKNLPDILPLLGLLLGLKYDDPRLDLGPKELQPHLQTAIRYLLEALAVRANRQQQPLLVILEDLQWLDDASLVTLDFLTLTLNLEEKRQHLAPKQILFLLLYRPEFQPSPTVRLETDWRQLELAALNPDDAQHLIESMTHAIALTPELKQSLMSRSAGNPFYLEEWVRLFMAQGADDDPAALPSSLKAVILSRIDRLGEESKLLLQKAAVVGRQFYGEILTDMEHKLKRQTRVPDVLQLLHQGDFIETLDHPRAAAYQFKHSLIQDVAYHALLVANRKILHRLAGEAVERAFADMLGEFYQELADHFVQAEMTAKALDYLTKAGDKACANYDNPRALTAYERLLHFIEQPLDKPDADEQRRRQALKIDTLLKKHYIWQIIGRWQECRELGPEILRLAEAANDPERRMKSHRVIGDVCRNQGQYDLCLQHFDQAVELAKALNDINGLSRAIGNKGIALLYKGELEQAVVCFREQLRAAQQTGDKNGIAHALGNMGNYFFQTNAVEDARKCFEKQLILYQTLNNKQKVARCSGNLGLIFHLQRDHQTALSYYTEYLMAGEELGNVADTAIAVGNLGTLYADSGDDIRALEAYHKNLVLARQLGDHRNLAMTFEKIAYIHFHRRELAEALEYYDQALTIGRQIGHKVGLCRYLIGKADVLTALNQWADAQPLCAEGRQLARELNDSEMCFRGEAISWRIDFRLRLTTQTPSEADPAIQRLKTMLTETEIPEELADLHFELWQIYRQGAELAQEKSTQAVWQGEAQKHHREALRRYQEIYTTSKLLEFKNRLAELQLQK